MLAWKVGKERFLWLCSIHASSSATGTSTCVLMQRQVLAVILHSVSEADANNTLTCA
jgi:hypothetical protein